MAAPCCHRCGRPLSVCREPVDERWPARAREAYARAELTEAATCTLGQAADLRATGWCWDRARFDRYWTGAPMTPGERHGAEVG
jgi:hypothetical protein